jgi:hypothetical protein
MPAVTSKNDSKESSHESAQAMHHQVIARKGKNGASYLRSSLPGTLIVACRSPSSQPSDDFNEFLLLLETVLDLVLSGSFQPHIFASSSTARSLSRIWPDSSRIILARKASKLVRPWAESSRLSVRLKSACFLMRKAEATQASSSEP